VKVIDSSALIKYLTKEEGWQRIEEHLREGCITLDLALKETANALIKKTLRNEVDIETAWQVIAHLPKIVKIVSQKESLEKAFKIAVENRTTIYDALFIALASNRKQILLTSDRKQAEISEKCGVITILV